MTIEKLKEKLNIFPKDWEIAITEGYTHTIRVYTEDNYGEEFSCDISLLD